MQYFNFDYYLVSPNAKILILAVGHARVFTSEQEEALARYLTEMENKLMGLEGTEVRKLAYEFAERLKIPHQFNHQKSKVLIQPKYIFHESFFL